MKIHILRSPVGSPCGIPIKLLGGVSLPQDTAKHPRDAALLGLGFLLELLQQLTLNGNGLPLARLFHGLFLLAHTNTYTLSIKEFHLNSHFMCDFMKLYAMYGV